MQTFYQDITRDVYALRLRGAENLEEYHLERGMEEMKKLAKDKQNLPELHKRKNDGDDEVELAHKRQNSEREEQVRATREAQISSHLCKGVLKSIHKDAKTVEKSPLVQLIAKEVTDGALTTLTLSDGQNFSSNVEPLNEELAEELNNIPMFDLIKIDCAMVRGDRVILTDIEHKAISNKDGDAIAISGPLTAPGVQVLEELRPELLQFWDIRFGDEVDVVFNAKTTANLDATLLQQDPHVTEVGQPSGAVPEPQPSVSGRNKRSLLLCPICDAMGIKRTFGDESKLKTHFNLEH